MLLEQYIIRTIYLDYYISLFIILRNVSFIAFVNKLSINIYFLQARFFFYKNL